MWKSEPENDTAEATVSKGNSRQEGETKINENEKADERSGGWSIQLRCVD